MTPTTEDNVANLCIALHFPVFLQMDMFAHITAYAVTGSLARVACLSVVIYTAIECE
jgi:hypothetical protein